MATTYYNLPTINGADTIDGVNAINGLANSTDAALRQVQNQIPDLTSISSQVTQATSTANTAMSTATQAATNAGNALTAASQAQSAAEAVSTEWNAAPVNVLNDTVQAYVTSSTALTAYQWGHVVTVKLANVQNLPYNTAVTIGHLKAGSWPASTDFLGTITGVAGDAPWGFVRIQASDGAIIVNMAGTGSSTATVVGSVCFLTGVS